MKENGIFYNCNEIGEPYDPNKIFKLGRIYNDHPDKNERTYTFLGVHLDEYLSFNYHCTLICNKLARSNFIISKVKNILPSKSLKTLYFALVHPHLLYCLPIYSCTTQKNLKRIFKMQKRPSGLSPNLKITPLLFPYSQN